MRPPGIAGGPSRATLHPEGRGPISGPGGGARGPDTKDGSCLPRGRFTNPAQTGGWRAPFHRGMRRGSQVFQMELFLKHLNPLFGSLDKLESMNSFSHYCTQQNFFHIILMQKFGRTY